LIWGLLADLAATLHLGFVAFAILGGLLVLRWRWVAWLHLPAAAWGVLIELTGGICPLTPLEVRFRGMAGEAGYSGGFVEHYLMPVLYPGDLTRGHQLLLGGLLAAFNLGLYTWIGIRRTRGKRFGQG